MIANVNLGKLFRHIQKLNISSDPKDKEELDFYLSIFRCFQNSLNPKVYCSIEPVSFKLCPLEKAQSLAIPLGLNVSEGGSSNYLSWSKGILEKD